MGCGCRGSGANTPREPQEISKQVLHEKRPTDPQAEDSVWRGRPVQRVPADPKA